MEKRKIYIGNLDPTVTPSLLYSTFSVHGKIVKVEKKYSTFAFIEYASDKSAFDAVLHLNNTKILNKRIVVSRFKFEKGQCEYKQPYWEEDFTACYGGTRNICEILTDNKELRRYCEEIEDRLLKIGLSCDIVFVNAPSMMNKILGTFRDKGTEYAIIVKDINAKLSTMSVITLQGSPVEHKDLPQHEGLKMIYKDYQLKIKGLERFSEAQKLPKNIEVFITSLITNKDLTALQYDELINYLAKRRKEQLEIEIGENNEKINDEVKMEVLAKAREDQRIIDALKMINGKF